MAQTDAKDVQQTLAPLLIPALHLRSAHDDSRRRRGPGSLNGFIVEQEHVWLSGYTLYIVEQWLVQRDRAVNAICVYTGKESDKIAVDVLRPNQALGDVELSRTTALDLFAEDSARPVETSLGVLHVTSMPTFPAELTTLLCPGSIAEHFEPLLTSLTARRLGLTGRSLLTFEPPSSSIQEKLHRLLHLPRYDSVTELMRILGLFVQLVQNGLALFGYGPCYQHQQVSHNKTAENADSLFCDHTVDGLRAFVADAGVRIGRREPSDAVVSVQALTYLFSSVIALRARLLALQVPKVPSDPFVERKLLLYAYHHCLRTASHLETRITFDGLLSIKKQAPEHSDGFIKTRLKSAVEEVTHRITDVTAHEKKATHGEEETTDIEVLVNGLRHGHWAEGISSVQEIWTGKTKPGPLLAVRPPPLIKIRKNSSDPRYHDGTSGSEAELDPASPTVGGRGHFLRGLARNKAARSGHETPHRRGQSVDDRLLPHNMLFLGPTLGESDMSRQATPNASTANLQETAAISRTQRSHNFRSIVPKFTARNNPANNSTHPTIIYSEPDNEASSTADVRPTHKMRRSATDMGGEPKSSVAVRVLERRRNLRRSASWSTRQDFSHLTLLIDRDRLMYDVRLIMAHYDLHKEERRLAELLEAMKSINDVLTSSHTRLDEPLQTRGDRLDDLHSRTKDMQDQLGEIAYDVVEQGKIDYSANEWLERAFQSHISEIERLQDVLEQAVGEKGHLTQVLEEASEPGYWSSFAPRLAALFGRRKAEVESRHSSADTSRRSSLS